jgi:adenylate cyclase
VDHGQSEWKHDAAGRADEHAPAALTGQGKADHGKTDSIKPENLGETAMQRPLSPLLFPTAKAKELFAWIVDVGLAGRTEQEIVSGFCERACAAGLPIDRVSVFVDTLHPSYAAQMFPWHRGTVRNIPVRYDRVAEGQTFRDWRESPFYRLVAKGGSPLRRRVTEDAAREHSLFAELRSEGLTEFAAMISLFSSHGTVGRMDCVYSSWSTSRAEGFSDDDMALLQDLVPLLALAIKATSLAEIAHTLAGTYLGRDAGQRVMDGRISRGVAEWIDAAFWFSDLRDYTRLAETIAPSEIIPLLNDYAEATISAILAEGGDVLKLIGDGTVAIFAGKDSEASCRSALAAAVGARKKVDELNARRSAAQLPSTTMYLGLHHGEVFFGNIGSKERLDFTVVGPAVNEASRIAAMCRSVDQPMLVSSAFAEALGSAKSRLVSVGRYALRGVRQPQELFTLEPDDG